MQGREWIWYQQSNTVPIVYEGSGQNQLYVCVLHSKNDFVYLQNIKESATCFMLCFKVMKAQFIAWLKLTLATACILHSIAIRLLPPHCMKCSCPCFPHSCTYQLFCGVCELRSAVHFRGIIGSLLTIATVLWCSWSASKLFITALQMDSQQLLVAYPCALVYAVFALLTVF